VRLLHVPGRHYGSDEVVAVVLDSGGRTVDEAKDRGGRRRVGEQGR